MTQLFFKTCREREPRGLNLDIDGWLRGIGLAQYAEMFRVNDIDIDLLERISSGRSQSRASSRRSPGSCARR